MNNEIMCRNSDCVPISWDLAIGQKDCKGETCSELNCRRQDSNFLHSDFSKKEATTVVSDAKTAVATNINEGGPTVLRIKQVNGNLSLSA